MPRQRDYFRWSAEIVQRETGVNARTFTSKATKAGVEPVLTAADVDNGKKRFYSTAQVMTILYDRYEEARIRKTNEEADSLRLANEQSKKALIDIGFFSKTWDAKLVEVKQIVETSALNADQQARILNGLADILHSFREGQAVDHGPSALPRLPDPSAKATA